MSTGEEAPRVPSVPGATPAADRTPLDVLALVDVGQAYGLSVQLEFRDGWRRPLESVRVVEVWTQRRELIARLPGSLLEAAVGQFVFGALLQNALALRLPTPAAPPRGDLKRATRRRVDAKPGPHVWVGDRIAAVRGALGLTWPAFARRVGVSRMTIARAERGEFLPKLATVQRIAAVGAVSVEWLLTGKDRAAPPAWSAEEAPQALAAERAAGLYAELSRLAATGNGRG